MIRQLHPWKNRTYIMGILNVTPDSFSDGGTYNSLDLAVKRAREIEKEGADIIDIGGESTRPRYQPVSEEEELERIIPVIRAVKANVNIPISVDTYKGRVADEAIRSGAMMINDVWGAKKDPSIASVAAKHRVPIILVHNRENKHYIDLISDIKKDLQASIHIAKKAGVKDDAIIIDPGLGFAKTGEHNLVILKKLEQIVQMNYPILLGASRKGFIGKILDEPVDRRDIGTGATTCLAIMKGVRIVRVHNVTLNKQLALMMDSILKDK